jgi:hypothetical protein
MILWKKIGILMIVLLLTSTVAIPVAAQPSSDLDTYVLFGLDSFSFKGGNDGAGLRGYVLGGNVGINNDDGDPNDAEVNVGANGRFVMSPNTEITGYQFRLGELATVWDVYRNEELGIGWPPAINPQTLLPVVRGTVYDWTPPIIPSGIDNYMTSDEFAEVLGCERGDFVASSDPNDDRTVVDREDLVDPPVKILTGSLLPAGTYRDLQVQDGNSLHLEAGTYIFRRFTTGRNVNIYTVPGTVIKITGDTDPNSRDFNIGVGSYFGSETATESVACICYVGDGDVQLATGGGSPNVIFWGVIKAPYANVNLGNSNNLYGRFYAKTFSSDFDVNINVRDCTPAPTTPVPEFPPLAVPIALIIGMMGAVAIIRRRME